MWHFQFEVAQIRGVLQISPPPFFETLRAWHGALLRIQPTPWPGLKYSIRPFYSKYFQYLMSGVRVYVAVNVGKT